MEKDKKCINMNMIKHCSRAAVSCSPDGQAGPCMGRCMAWCMGAWLGGVGMGVGGGEKCSGVLLELVRLYYDFIKKISISMITIK